MEATVTKINLDEKSLRDLGMKMLNSVNVEDRVIAVDELENVTQFCVKMISVLVIKTTDDKDEALAIIEKVSKYMNDIVAGNYNEIIEKGMKQ